MADEENGKLDFNLAGPYAQEAMEAWKDFGSGESDDILSDEAAEKLLANNEELKKAVKYFAEQWNAQDNDHKFEGEYAEVDALKFLYQISWDEDDRKPDSNRLLGFTTYLANSLRFKGLGAEIFNDKEVQDAVKDYVNEIDPTQKHIKPKDAFALLWDDFVKENIKEKDEKPTVDAFFKFVKQKPMLKGKGNFGNIVGNKGNEADLEGKDNGKSLPDGNSEKGVMEGTKKSTDEIPTIGVEENKPEDVYANRSFSNKKAYWGRLPDGETLADFFCDIPVAWSEWLDGLMRQRYAELWAKIEWQRKSQAKVTQDVLLDRNGQAGLISQMVEQIEKGDIDNAGKKLDEIKIFIGKNSSKYLDVRAARKSLKNITEELKNYDTTTPSKELAKKIKTHTKTLGHAVLNEQVFVRRAAAER